MKARFKDWRLYDDGLVEFNYLIDALGIYASVSPMTYLERIDCTTRKDLSIGMEQPETRACKDEAFMLAFYLQNRLGYDVKFDDQEMDDEYIRVSEKMRTRFKEHEFIISIYEFCDMFETFNPILFAYPNPMLN